MNKLFVFSIYFDFETNEFSVLNSFKDEIIADEKWKLKEQEQSKIEKQNGKIECSGRKKLYFKVQ